MARTGLEALAYMSKYRLYKVIVKWCFAKIAKNEIIGKGKNSVVQIVLSYIWYS